MSDLSDDADRRADRARAFDPWSPLGRDATRYPTLRVLDASDDGDAGEEPAPTAADFGMSAEVAREVLSWRYHTSTLDLDGRIVAEVRQASLSPLWLEAVRALPDDEAAPYRAVLAAEGAAMMLMMAWLGCTWPRPDPVRASA